MQETGGITCTNLPDLTEYDGADRTYGVRFALFCQSEDLTSLWDGDKIYLLRFEAVCPEVRRNSELYGGINHVSDPCDTDGSPETEAGG